MRAFSWGQLLETGFDKNEYCFPDHEGNYNALLVTKQWGDKACLTGFFITHAGEKIKANAWHEREYLGLDIVNPGTILNLSFQRNSKGIVVLRNAIVVKDACSDRSRLCL